MGFGFNLFVAFVLPLLLLLSVIFVIYFLARKEHKLAKSIFKGWGIFFLVLFVLIGVVYCVHFFTDKTVVDSDDIYGAYVIDRSKYSGKQSDWQYDHYRFEITKQDSFLFDVTDKEKIIKTYKGKVVNANKGRIVLKMDSPTIKIIADTPTLYRNTFSFYYVFHSKYYNNVFFKKAKWQNK